jgi:hypothetical protein
VTDLLREIRPILPPPFELRFETPPGQQAQVDFAQFQTEFTDDPGVIRIVWLFSLVLGHSRMMWGRFVLHQDLPTVLRCHIAAFEALGGVPQPLRSHEDGGDRRRRRGRSHLLQSHTARLRPPLRLPAQGVPSVSRQDQGQGRTAVSLCA